MIVMIDDYDKYAEEHPEVKVVDKWETHGVKFVMFDKPTSVPQENRVRITKTRKRKKP